MTLKKFIFYYCIEIITRKREIIFKKRKKKYTRLKEIDTESNFKSFKKKNLIDVYYINHNRQIKDLIDTIFLK